MHYVRSFFEFWYDFIVGDDWMVAAAVVVTLAVLIGLAHAHVQAWWLLPLVVVLTLGGSLLRATRSA